MTEICIHALHAKAMHVQSAARSKNPAVSVAALLAVLGIRNVVKRATSTSRIVGRRGRRPVHVSFGSVRYYYFN